MSTRKNRFFSKAENKMLYYDLKASAERFKKGRKTIEEQVAAYRIGLLDRLEQDFLKDLTRGVEVGMGASEIAYLLDTQNWSTGKEYLDRVPDVATVDEEEFVPPVELFTTPGGYTAVRVNYAVNNGVEDRRYAGAEVMIDNNTGEEVISFEGVYHFASRPGFDVIKGALGSIWSKVEEGLEKRRSEDEQGD